MEVQVKVGLRVRLGSVDSNEAPGKIPFAG